MFTLKCKHCGKTFEAKQRSRLFCSDECSKVGKKIAAFGKEKPVGFERIRSRSTMAGQIVQEGDSW